MYTCSQGSCALPAALHRVPLGGVPHLTIVSVDLAIMIVKGWLPPVVVIRRAGMQITSQASSNRQIVGKFS